MKATFRKMLMCAFLIIPFNVSATEIIHYENMPVTLHLHVDSERSIQFGDHVQVGVTKGQKMKKLFRVQSAQGVVHILPYKEFNKQRIQVKRLTDGRVILLDIVSEKPSKKAKSLEDVKIVLEFENKIIIDTVVKQENSSVVITPIDLTRYAAQRLYGPSRLHNDVPGITEAILGVDGAVRIFKGPNKHLTVSKPVVAYQGGGYYLAGIHITNISEETVDLNYLELNLSFSHAIFQHHQLHSNGTSGDSTILYLLSEKPLKEVFYPWSYYQDLRAEATQTIVREKAEEKKNANPYRHGFK